MVWQPTQDEIDELLAASGWTYNRAIPPVATSTWSQFIPEPDNTVDSDGFYGAAYTNGTQIVIAFEGSWWWPPAYALGSWVVADGAILGGQLPAAAQDAVSYAAAVIGAAELEGIPTSDIYLTGHSLGGLEAEAVAQYEYDLPNSISLAGATFGAPGLPGNTIADQDPNLIDYVDYGDPIGNFASDPPSPTSGDTVVPAAAYHFGQVVSVGSSTDSSSFEISAFLTAFDVLTGDGVAAAIYAANAWAGLTYHSLENYNVAVPEAVAAGSGTTATSPVVDVTGSVTTNLSQSIENNDTSYSFVSVSPSLTLNGGAPLTLSATARPSSSGVEYWSSFQTWDSGGVLELEYLYNAGFAVADFIGGVLDLDPLVLWQFASTVNTLENIGPTNGDLTLPGIGLADVFGVSVSVSASIQLDFNVTIGAGADVLMDQASVKVDNLTIDPGGTLTAGSGGFIVGGYLYNEGSLEVLPGAGGGVDNGLFNSGILVLDGVLSVQGSMFNSGLIEFLVDYSFTSAPIDNFGGTIDVASGSVLLSGSSLAGGVIQVDSGGTVGVGQFGTLDAVVLSGSGVVQGLTSTYSQGEYGSVLQDVTLGAGVTYTELAGNVTTLLGAIVNAGTLAGNYFAIDGTVTLSGAGQVSLTGGSFESATAANIVGHSTLAAALINTDNTISGSSDLANISLTNQSGGVIDANLSGQSLYLQGAVVNRGLAEATNGGTLNIYAGAAFDNTGGIVQAGSLGVVDVTDEALSNGSIVIAAGGTVGVGQFGTLDAVVLSGSGVVQGLTSTYSQGEYGSVLQDVTLGAGVTYTELAGNVTTLLGAIVNAGTLAGNYFAIDGMVTLSGGGQVSLTGGSFESATAANIVGHSTLAAALINTDNTISGSSDLANISLTNQSGGVIDANLSGQSLYLQGAVVNRGLAEATNGGTLNIYAGAAFDNTGGIVQAGSLGVVDVTDEALSNGSIVIAAGGTVGVGQFGTLDAVVLSGSGVVQGLTSTYSQGEYGSVLQDVTLGAGVTYTELAGNVTTLLGAIVNAGTLAGNYFAIDGTVTLSGGGQVSLTGGSFESATAANIVGHSTLAAALINTDNTISGSSDLANISLTNQSGGVIDANLSGQSLYLQGAVVNRGLAEATNGGTLNIYAGAAFDNTGGIVQAGSLGVVDVTDEALSNGSIVIAAGGTVGVGQFGTLDAVVLSGSGVVQGLTSTYSQGEYGSVLQDVTLGAGVTYTELAGNVTTLLGAIVNAGTLAGNYFAIDGTVTLSGGGQVSLTGGSFESATAANIVGHSTLAAALINTDNTISGSSDLANISLTNQSGGVIDANLSGQSLYLQGAVVNRGLAEATNGGTLNIYAGAAFDNTGGIVQAGSLGVVDVTDEALSNGSIVIAAGGTVGVGQFGTLDAVVLSGSGVVQGLTSTYSQGEYGSVLQDVTLGAGVTYTELAGNVTTLLGAIVNAGTLAGNYFAIDGMVTLSGGGQVSLTGGSFESATAANIVGHSTLAAALINTDNTISGSSDLANISLTNQSGGVIDANLSGQSLYLQGAVVNRGLAEATNGGTLNIYAGAAFDNTGGIVQAGSLGVVDVTDEALSNGSIVIAAGGTVGVGQFGTLDAVVLSGSGVVQGLTSTYSQGEYGSVLQDVTLGAGVTYTELAGNVTTLLGAIVNAGTLAGNYFAIDGMVTLSGGGQVSLTGGSFESATAANIVGHSTLAAALINTDNTISGSSDLANISLTNQSGGVIDANLSGQSLYLQGAVVNRGLAEATNGGTLNIYAGAAFDNTGGIVQAGSLGVVDVTDEALSNGSIVIAAGGTVGVGQFGTLDAVVLSGSGVVQGLTSTYSQGEYGSVLQDVTLGAGVTYTELAGNVTTLLGAIVNAGTLAGNYFAIDGMVTLSGGGQVSLTGGSFESATAANIVGHSTLAAALINTDNTISGSSDLANISLTNQSGGVIDANLSGQSLYLQGAVVNRGLAEATNGGTLNIYAGAAFDNTGGIVQAGSLGVVDVTDEALSNGSIEAESQGLIDVASTIIGATLSTSGSGLIDLLSGGALSDVTVSSGSQIMVSGGYTATMTGTIINRGTISGNTGLTGTGILSNLGGATIGGAIIAMAAGETVANFGTVSGVVYLSGGDRIVTGAGAIFTAGINGGTGDNTLEIATGPYALTNFDAVGTPQFSTLQIDDGVSVTADNTDLLSGVTLINNGTLDLGEFEATTPVQNSGSIAGDVTLASGVPLINAPSGTISGTGLAVIEALGLASVTNSGVIDPAEYGVDLTAGGSVTNAAGGTVEGTVAGVYISGGAGTVTNAGLISGGGTDAVTIAAGFTNRVILDAGAAFIGVVDGGNTIGAAAVSTLELASGLVAGTLNGFGTEFVNFAQVAVGSGAAWYFGTGDALAAGTALTDQGTLVLNGSTVTGGGAVTIDGIAGSPASAVIAGGGTWSGTSRFVVGATSPGELFITTAGSVSTAGVDAAQSVGSFGEITVTGTRSLLSNSGSLVIGDGGLGSLSVQASGTVTAGAALIVASTSSSAGSAVNISGTGSALNVTGLLDVGVDGSGALSISNGASVTAGSLDAGNVAAGVAYISVTDANFTVAGSATVADDGTGVISVLGGATFSASSLTIGSAGNSSGALIVSGSGSVVDLSGALNIGTALGTGDLTIGPGAAVHASIVDLQGQVVLEGGLLDPTVTVIQQGVTAGGFGTVAAGDVIDEGAIQSGGTGPSQQLLVVQGTLLGGGTLTINGTLQGASATGLLQINSGSTLELTGPVLNAATTIFQDEQLVPSSYTLNNSVIEVSFANGEGALVLDDVAGFGGTISAYHAGDAFVITGGTLSGLSVDNGNTLIFADSGINAAAGRIDQIIFGSAISAAGFSIANGNTIQIACFAAGTRIGTLKGPVAVEDLLEGEQVIAWSGRVEQVIWIGRRAVNCQAHPKPETVWPVRIQAGTFGPKLPERDLMLSPDHAVFLNGVLIPIKHLINHTTVAQVPMDNVTYYHVELAEHAVILAEGLPCESYLDMGDRSDFENGGNVVRLFPDFSASSRDTATLWETKGCAPLVIHGPELGEARAFLAAQAGTMTSIWMAA